MEIMSTKYKDWSYEEEFRFLPANELLKENRFYTKSFSDALTDIYFGCRCTDFDIITVTAHCVMSGLNSRFWKARMDNESYSLRFEPFAREEVKKVIQQRSQRT